MNENNTEAVISDLIKDARDRSSWETRLNAVKELENYDTPKTHDVIISLALHDRVYAVKEEAASIANRLGLKKDGQKIVVTKKDTKYKNSDFTKLFHQVKRELEMEEFDLELFKEKFSTVNPEMYDTMQYEHKDKFDTWVENKYMNLPKK
ncbi:HEAT repeat domain-containing protein [Chryseomicrobium sp. FSL W7-1435]|uniref:HEAT repeat domain-containing protein n=1 Tax=Chryseomicrobium sp. FSL W7-1435 TaxID=2921704 RepID=UPI003159CA85